MSSCAKSSGRSWSPPSRCPPPARQVRSRPTYSSADFFVDGVRDDVQYYRDLYNLERVETLKGPNAMIFGRGGAGGVVNRVSREAGFRASRDMTLQGGMFGNRRLTAGINEPLNDKVAFRLDGMFEHSDSFRHGVGLERYGVTPTATIAAGPNTKVTLRYEYLNDTRNADRGITSFQGRPANVDFSTLYGNPALSDVQASVNVASGLVEHRAGRITIRNRTVAANYDRFYQNFVPGAATASQSQVALTSYNNASNRTNVFNQTDVTSVVSTGRIRHTLLAGTEFGRDAAGASAAQRGEPVRLGVLHQRRQQYQHLARFPPRGEGWPERDLLAGC
jgi:catecholate siderophore receptor